MQRNSIKFYRKKKKLSQGKLGDAIGVNHRTIHGYETSAKVPDSQWPLLAKALDTTPEKLQAPPPISYLEGEGLSAGLSESAGVDWLEFVEWLTAEMPLETLQEKAEAAFDEKNDQFEDWTRKLLRRRRDAEGGTEQISGHSTGAVVAAHLIAAKKSKPEVP